MDAGAGAVVRNGGPPYERVTGIVSGSGQVRLGGGLAAGPVGWYTSRNGEQVRFEPFAGVDNFAEVHTAGVPKRE